MVTAIFIISTLLLPCLFLSIIYYTIRMWLVRREFQQSSYQEKPTYKKLQKRRRFVACALPIAFIVCFASALIYEDIQSDERAAQLLAKAESYTGEDKSFYESKFYEFKESMGESKARKKAVELTEKNIEYNYRINNFNDEKRTFFNEKFNEYKKSMDEFSAKEKAINDLDEEFDKRDKELQKKYDDQKQYEEWIAWQQSEKEKAEKAELQKKYDDQKQYEEWIAWQQSEKEKAELQKKYDDQKKYEEWIAWQKSEDDKRLAAEAKERERQEAERNKYSSVNVWDIYNAYKGNAARANKSYAGKYVKIMGSVVVNIESGGHVISTGVIEGNEYFSIPHAFIHCYPKTEDAKSAIYNMNNNQTIIIYGKVKEVGEVMGYYVDVDKFEW